MDEELRLRPVEENDLPLLYRLTSDPAGSGEFGWFGWMDPGIFRRQWAENGLLGEDGGFLVVATGAESAGFMNWRKHKTGTVSHCWEIGIALAPEVRGRGYGTHAHRLLVAYLFAHTMVNRVEAVTETANIAEQRALEKAGFAREGVMRGCGWRDGRWVDGVVYSILRSEVDLGGTS
jgi:RimJ/RimL family protein N-acetyltransferase